MKKLIAIVLFLLSISAYASNETYYCPPSVSCQNNQVIFNDHLHWSADDCSINVTTLNFFKVYANGVAYCTYQNYDDGETIVLRANSTNVYPDITLPNHWLNGDCKGNPNKCPLVNYIY